MGFYVRRLTGKPAVSPFQLTQLRAGGEYPIPENVRKDQATGLLEKRTDRLGWKQGLFSFA